MRNVGRWSYASQAQKADGRMRMNEHELRELVTLPTMNTRRADGISNIDVMSLLDSATQVVSQK